MKKIANSQRNSVLISEGRDSIIADSFITHLPPSPWDGKAKGRLQLRKNRDSLHDQFDQEKRRPGQQQTDRLALDPTNPLHPGIPRASQMMDDNFRSSVMGDKLHTKLTRSGRPIAKFVHFFKVGRHAAAQHLSKSSWITSCETLDLAQETAKCACLKELPILIAQRTRRFIVKLINYIWRLFGISPSLSGGWKIRAASREGGYLICRPNFSCAFDVEDFRWKKRTFYPYRDIADRYYTDDGKSRRLSEQQRSEISAIIVGALGGPDLVEVNLTK